MRQELPTKGGEREELERRKEENQAQEKGGEMRNKRREGVEGRGQLGDKEKKRSRSMQKKGEKQKAQLPKFLPFSFVFNFLLIYFKNLKFNP